MKKGVELGGKMGSATAGTAGNAGASDGDGDGSPGCKRAGLSRVPDCNRCKEWRKHMYWDHTDTKGKMFFKVLVGDFFHGLALPLKFVTNFKEELAETICLEDSYSQKWQVWLKANAGRVYLDSGWKSFVESHGLEEYNFLVFNYKGNSCFNVFIFDESGSEKEYSYFVNKKQNMHKGRNKAFLGSSNASSDDRFPANSSSSSLHKKETSVIAPNSKIFDEHTTVARNINCRSTLISRRRPVTDAERETTLKSAKKFRTFGVSFLSQMKYFNVYKIFYLIIPRGFARKHLPDKSQKIILRLPSAKKEWEVGYVYGEHSYRFAGNWWRFASENNLEAGDVCVFELARGNRRLEMTVYIFRVVKEIVPLIPAL